MPRKSDKKNCACEVTGDGLGVEPGRRLYDQDATAWLVGEGVRHMNAADAEGELAYVRVLELLRKTEEAASTIARVASIAPAEDISLRWSLLYLLADLEEARGLDVFLATAIEAVPARSRESRGCESARDGEILVRTMAIEGLGRLASSDKHALHALFEVIERQAEPALRIEAVKAVLSVAPDQVDRLREILPEDLRFAVDIKKVRAEVLDVDFDSKAVDKVRRTPSLDKTAITTPQSGCGPCC